MKTRLLLFSLLFALPLPLLAQEDPLLEELTLLAVGADSDNPEFPSPYGLGIRSTWSVGQHWLFGLSIHRLNDSSRKMGIVCKTYAPHIDCRPSVTDNEVNLTGLRGHLLRSMVLGGRLRLGLGGGLSFNSLGAESLAEDGRRADLLVPKTDMVGYLALLSADLILVPGFPLRLTGGLTNHWVHFHTCSGANPPQYDPFCEISRFSEAELGLTMAF